METKFNRKQGVKSKYPTLTEKLLKNKGDSLNFIECCPQHNDNQSEYFCCSHSQLCCRICRDEQHKKCSHVKNVTDVSKGIRETEDYKEFVTILKTTAATTKELITDAEKKVILVENNHSNIVGSIKQMRKELNEALDKVEDELLKQAENLKHEETTKVRAISDKCKATYTELQALMKRLEDLQNTEQDSNTFITMQRASPKLKDTKATVTGFAKDTEVKGHLFQPNKAILKTLSRPNTLGKLYPELRADYLQDINIRTTEDTCQCWITGSTALPNDVLIVADRGNSKIKVIDTKHCVVSSQLPLISRPWSVTKISDNSIATTVPYIKKVLIIKNEIQPIVEREITVNGKCHGIAHCNGKLIVTYNKSNKVEIIEMTGSVLNTIDSKGQLQFNFPEYVALAPEKDMALDKKSTLEKTTIYVSNYLSNSLISVGLDGKVRDVYKDTELDHPRQVAVDQNGMIYVCGSGSQNVHLLSCDFKKVKMLLTDTAGLRNPRSMCLNQKGDKLYIDHSPDNIKVYKVSQFLPSAP